MPPCWTYSIELSSKCTIDPSSSSLLTFSVSIYACIAIKEFSVQGYRKQKWHQVAPCIHWHQVAHHCWTYSIELCSKWTIDPRALCMVKNASNQKRSTLYTIKNLLLPQLSASEIFPVAFFGYKFLKLLQNCDWKKIIFWIWCLWEKFRLQKAGVAAGFS